MTLWKNRKGKVLIIALVVLVCSTLIVTVVYSVATKGRVTPRTTLSGKILFGGIIHTTPTMLPTPTPTPTPLPLGPILGIEGGLTTAYSNIPWVRYSYRSCSSNKTSGDALRNAIAAEHSKGIRVLITTCQAPGSSLYNTAPLKDIAQSRPDAVQCGNEEMKYDKFTSYVPPASFARYFDLCQRIMHSVSPTMPVLLGSLDPQVGGVDFQGLSNQVGYLNAMQAAMNSSVHPGGHWSWRSQTLGLIDSWHNGYPNSSTNSLYGLFLFWAQQFNVNLDNGGLGKHIWVVEGTGCYLGCGINPYSSYEVAVSHILTLITDVQTAMRYRVPFFYFSSRDFYFTSGGGIAPFGIQDVHGHPKPIRQDLPMGARALTMSCSNGKVVVTDQQRLLGALYAGCRLPSNYLSILTS